MTWTHNSHPIRLPDRPRTPREWVVHLPVPDGVRLSDHAAHDRMAADLAPEGYIVAGTIPVSGRDTPRDQAADPRWWRIRVTYVPATWRRERRAPIPVYAAAQMVGMPTSLDDVLCADWHGIQHRTPDGRPTYRECYRWQRELPADIAQALSDLEYISSRRSIGYMWSRPDTARAQLVAAQEADADDARYERARAVVRDWVARHYPGL